MTLGEAPGCSEQIFYRSLKFILKIFIGFLGPGLRHIFMRVSSRTPFLNHGNFIKSILIREQAN